MTDVALRDILPFAKGPDRLWSSTKARPLRSRKGCSRSPNAPDPCVVVPYHRSSPFPGSRSSHSAQSGDNRSRFIAV